MIRFDTKPSHHVRAPCARCRMAAQEGALRVHVLVRSEHLRARYWPKAAT
jgi:hypothetical protein